MRAKQKQRIHFAEARTASELISANSAFVRQNLSILVRSVAVIALPFILIGQIGSAIPQLLMLEQLNMPFPGFEFSFMQFSELPEGIGVPDYFFSFGISLLFTFIAYIGYILVIAINYEYIQLYRAKSLEGSNDSAVSNRQLYRQVFSKVYQYVINLLVVVFLLFFVFAFGALLSLFGLNDRFNILFWLAILFSPFFLIYILLPFNFLFIVQAVEGFDVVANIKRSFDIVHEYRLSTLGYLLVTFLIYTSFSAIPLLIYALLPFLINFTGIGLPVFSLMLIALLLQVVLNTFASIFLFNAIAFKYFDLVERHEGVGSYKKIARIGKDLAKPNSAYL